MISIDALRDFVLALPDVEERRTWGKPTFRVRGRMFVTLDPAAPAATCKASHEEQAALLASDPETFAFPAYVGHHGWIRVRLDRVTAEEMRELATEAWRRTAPKRLVRRFDGSTGSDS
ncbi:MmcQ/YjbR family DNA-binding protein [Actinopolyspora mortivallis]|uniref:MmcQ/YjbR family DNA-binding protein n=1 Tax=Actinopolyspora mortivallis TaxID=33906 RepID=UPI000371BA04|nr:MmcQ/YjbR family DNA-binding protein [Actinopolyspora mortivallis]